MHISARSDYAVRACIVLAAAGAAPPRARRSRSRAAASQAKFLEAILEGVATQAGSSQSRRGADGGYWLARPGRDDVTVADVIRAVDGPLAEVRGGPPEAVD